VSSGLRDGFTYYMDEQDKEWVDTRNGSYSVEPLTSRGRSAKVKAKDTQVVSTFPVTYDEFELVMGILEIITEQKAPLLHHVGTITMRAFSMLTASQNHGGNTLYPPLSEYQDVLSRTLPSYFFSNWATPSWVPQPHRMLSLVETVFAYWQDRRKARNGHRIFPTPTVGFRTRAVFSSAR
jgi:enhancer of polycomb-like protein